MEHRGSSQSIKCYAFDEDLKEYLEYKKNLMREEKMFNKKKYNTNILLL